MVRSPFKLDDFAGPAAALAEMRTLVSVLKGEDPQGPARILVTGKPGCGRNSMVDAAAREAGVECVLFWVTECTMEVEVLRQFREVRGKDTTVLLVLESHCSQPGVNALLAQEITSFRNVNLVIVMIADRPEAVDERLRSALPHHVEIGRAHV